MVYAHPEVPTYNCAGGLSAAIFADGSLISTLNQIGLYDSTDEAYGFRFSSIARCIPHSGCQSRRRARDPDRHARHGYAKSGPRPFRAGDTAPADSVAQGCNGCDVLVHEVYTQDPQHPMSPSWQTYFAAFHTSTQELAAMATRAKPKLLVLYHQLFHGESEGEMLQEVRQHYAGAVVSAHDLDVY